MNCPRCGHKQTCPCKSCQKRNPTEKPWVWKGEDIHCSECNLTTDWLKVEADDDYDLGDLVEDIVEDFFDD